MMNAPVPWKSRLLHFGICLPRREGVVHHIRTVVAQLAQAQAEGYLPTSDGDYPPSAATIARNREIYAIQHGTDGMMKTAGWGSRRSGTVMFFFAYLFHCASNPDIGYATGLRASWSALCLPMSVSTSAAITGCI